MSIAIQCRRACSLLFASAALLVAPAAAQPIGLGDDSPWGPRYVARAISVKALDETGWDWPGSDEVWLELWDFDRAKIGPVYFSDFDTGEKKTVPFAKSCISAMPTCAQGTSSLHFGLGLWEVDDWDVVELLGASFCPGRFQDDSTQDQIFDREDEPITYPECETSGEDLIGKAKVRLSPAELAALSLAVGQSVDRVIKPTGGSGSYEITYRITRLGDAEPIVSDGGGSSPTQTDVPNLTASYNELARGVVLTWSGAVGNLVDIRRNNALIVTTPNDGQHTDQVGSGTYQYQVCSGGTNNCSSSVSVAVP